MNKKMTQIVREAPVKSNLFGRFIKFIATYLFGTGNVLVKSLGIAVLLAAASASQSAHAASANLCLTGEFAVDGTINPDGKGGASIIYCSEVGSTVSVGFVSSSFQNFDDLALDGLAQDILEAFLVGSDGNPWLNHTTVDFLKSAGMASMQPLCTTSDRTGNCTITAISTVVGSNTAKVMNIKHALPQQ